MRIDFATDDQIVDVFDMFADFSGEEVEKLGIEFDRERLMNTVRDMVERKAVLVMKTMTGRIIGAVAGMLTPCAFSKDILFTAFLFYIHPEFRHKTAHFLKELVQFLKHTPATKLVISSPVYGGDQMNRFYHMNGFNKLETHFIRPIERTKCPQT